MSRILKSIAPYWKSIIIILLLLVLQANCDLALPQYTSNIIDVGIQNGGIGHSIPEKITKDEYDIAKMFMTDEEISIWEKCFEEQDDLYVRTENNDKRLDEYDDTLAMALIINNQMSSVTVTQFKQQMAAQMGVDVSELENVSVADLGKRMGVELETFTKDIEDGTFFKNEELLEAMENCKKNDSDLHLFGLLSDGGVHSHLSHVYGLLEMAKQQGVSKVYVHAFLDGRDTPPASAKGFVETLENKMAEIGVGKVASLSGRYYAMDRDNNWDRVEKAYDSLVTGDGIKAESATQALQESYDNGKTDEFVEPTVICKDGQPLSLVKANDSVIFFNFRPDRAREMTRAFCDDKFTGFERKTGFIPLTFVCFKDYDESIPNKKVAFKKEIIKNTFGEFLANHGKKQLRLAETEKYAHVTFFFNGGVEDPNVDEFRLLVNSPKDVATYDLKPEMSAPEVGMDLVEAIKSDKYDVIIINFANPDMVGHTGVIPAAIKAVEKVDELVGKAVDAVKDVDGVLFICADHGNAEKMIDYETGAPHTAHTTNPVPFILVNYDENYTLREGGRLCDIAPTLIEIMGLEKPVEMTGESLLVKKN